VNFSPGYVDTSRSAPMANVPLQILQIEEVVDPVKYVEVKRCIASNICTTAVTHYEVRALINAGGGEGSISCVQKPGRVVIWEPDFSGNEVLRYAPVEDAMEMVPHPDIAHWRSVVRDSWARRRGYESYDSVESVGNLLRSCV
jgi:hypothetical protein